MFGYGGRNKFDNWFIAIRIEVIARSNFMCGYVIGVEGLVGCQ